MLSDFPQVWENLLFAERREMLRHLVEKLEVDCPQGQGQGELVGTIVRLKLHLLPEQEFIVPPQKRERGKKTTSGVARLTPRHLALLYWLEQGMTTAGRRTTGIALHQCA